MHRESNEAYWLAANTAAERRQLERWSHAGLLWPDGTPLGCCLEHVRLLVRLATRRSGVTTKDEANDQRALILAAHGFCCLRLRDAIARCGTHYASADDLAHRLRASPPTTVRAMTDEGLAQLEAEAEEIQALVEAGQEPVPGLAAMMQGIRKLLDPAHGAAPIVDIATGRSTTPEQVWHAFVTNTLAAGAGDGLYDEGPLTVLPTTDGVLTEDDRVMLDVLRDGHLFCDAERIAVYASDAQLVMGAVLLREQLRQIGDQDEKDRDVQAAVGAPAFLALLNRVYHEDPQAAIRLAAMLAPTQSFTT